QVFWIRKVNPVIASKLVWRTTDSQMNFLRASLPEIAHAGSRGCTPDNRVIDNDNPLVRNEFLDQIQLHPDVEIANELRRLEKRSANVVVPHKCVLIGNIQFMAESQSRVISGIRHRHHNIGRHWMQPRKFASHGNSNLAHITATYLAIGARKIDIFEHAESFALFPERPFRPDAVVIDHHNFARLDLADKIRVDEVQSASFRRQDKCIIEFTENQWSKPEWVAHANDLLFAHQNKRKRSLDLPEGGQNVFLARGASQQVKDNLAVNRRLKD